MGLIKIKITAVNNSGNQPQISVASPCKCLSNLNQKVNYYQCSLCQITHREDCHLLPAKSLLNYEAYDFCDDCLWNQPCDWETVDQAIALDQEQNNQDSDNYDQDAE